MASLEVPGARLYYELHGSGPLLFMIPGAAGTGDSFGRVTTQLAAHYTVVTYDRRGFSRSQLDGPQDYDQRLETDADDVRRLLEQFSDQPATVFGSSSGAIVALEVLIRHPAVVRTLMPHEPPAMKLLPDGQHWVNCFYDVYALYHKAGIAAALTQFREQAFAASDQEAMAHAPTNQYSMPNATYWFEHELRQYPAVDLDIAALKAHAACVVPVAGRKSRGFPTYAASTALAQLLGRDLRELPGGHVGFLTQPVEFTQALVQALAAVAA